MHACFTLSSLANVSPNDWLFNLSCAAMRLRSPVSSSCNCRWCCKTFSILDVSCSRVVDLIHIISINHTQSTLSYRRRLRKWSCGSWCVSSSIVRRNQCRWKKLTTYLDSFVGYLHSPALNWHIRIDARATREIACSTLTGSSSGIALSCCSHSGSSGCWIRFNPSKISCFVACISVTPLLISTCCSSISTQCKSKECIIPYLVALSVL